MIIIIEIFTFTISIMMLLIALVDLVWRLSNHKR